MFTVTFENHKGEQIQLYPSVKYTITEITGLNPPSANINTSANANFDGSFFKSSRLNERNIVISLAIEGNAEDNRNELYKYIINKKKCRIIYTNGLHNVYIEGYVETFEISMFNEKETAQISVVCPNPYFKKTESSYVEFVSAIPLFEFPFSIAAAGIEFSRLSLGEEKVLYNAGNAETGMIIEFSAIGQTSNPTLYNVETGKMMKVYLEMDTGDILRINTIKGEKSITKVIDGVETNAINLMDKDSDWLQLESGDNILLYTADYLPLNLVCTLIYRELFEGV